MPIKCYEEDEVVVSVEDLENAEWDLSTMFNIVGYIWNKCSVDPFDDNRSCDDVLSKVIYRLIDLGHEIWFQYFRYDKEFDDVFYSEILEELNNIRKRVHKHIEKGGKE